MRSQPKHGDTTLIIAKIIKWINCEDANPRPLDNPRGPFILLTFPYGPVQDDKKAQDRYNQANAENWLGAIYDRYSGGVFIGAEHVNPSKIITVRGNIGSDTGHHLSWDDRQREGFQ
jgi:hypothetical protein